MHSQSTSSGIDERLMAANLREEKQKEKSAKIDRSGMSINEQEPQSLREAVLQAKRQREIRSLALKKTALSGKGKLKSASEVMSAMKKFNKTMKIVALVNFLLPVIFFVIVVLIGFGVIYTKWWGPLVTWWYGTEKQVSTIIKKLQSTEPLKGVNEDVLKNNFSGTEDRMNGS